MELMSSLLFYAFVAMLPLALDAECVKCRTCMKRAIKEYIDNKKHEDAGPSSLAKEYINNKQHEDVGTSSLDMHHELLLSSNNSMFPFETSSRPYRDKHVEHSSNLTQSDENSDKYAVQQLKSQEKLNSVYQSGSIKGLDKLDYEGLLNIRQKRESLLNMSEEKKYRKIYDMDKVERLPNAITVTKYNLNGKTYALKVKETIKDSKLKGNTEYSCNVFKVVQTFACGSKDAESLLTAAKSRSKSRKKVHPKIVKKPLTTTTTSTTSTTTTTTTKLSSTPIAKKMSTHKRDIGSHMSKEIYMASTEDLY